MKRNAGLIATMTVLVAFFGLSSMPKSDTGSGSVSETKNRSKSAAKPNASNTPVPSRACEEIRKRLQYFVNQSPPENWLLPDSCYVPNKAPKGLQSVSASTGLNFVITTVPNPITTHIPLLFDRMIGVIQQAAQDDNYSYDSSWFPWDEMAKDYPLFGDRRAAEEAQEIRDAQPGVVVFRRAVVDAKTDLSPYGGGLVVFVVAEQPTGGIDRDEFENALAWMERLGVLTLDRGLKILGPTFSGSLASLDLALDSAKLTPRPGAPQIQVSVSSGSVSSQTNFLWFQNRMRASHSGTFRTALEGDSLMIDRLVNYLVEQEHYPPGQIAIISEDETAYGNKDPQDGLQDDSKKDHGDAPRAIEANEKKQQIHLYYPRDIATLRSAYVQQSIFSTGKQQPNGNTQSPTLRGDLSEPNSSDHDTVRSYGGGLTPLAQESVLLAIVKTLKEKQIQFVVLTNTNSIDQIFLAQFFKHAYPAARIVLDGADLLFARGAEGSSLRGVMTLSTYPLLTWQQDWTPTLLHPNAGSYRIFGDYITEGLYIAARETFDPPPPQSSVPIGNYAPPAWLPTSSADDPRPATWLSVIGHHQFWPVAALRQYPASDSTAVELLPTACRLQEKVYPAGAAVHPLLIPTELAVLLIVCLVWSGLHCLWCSHGSISPFRSYFELAHFAPLGEKQHPALIAFGSFLPAAAAVVTAATCGLLDWSLSGTFGARLCVWLLAVVGASFLACLANFTLPDLSGASSGAWQRWVVAASLVAFAVFTFGHYRIVWGLSDANRITGYWRNAHVLNGVSSLLPQLILLAGMYLWFWFSLRGLALFGHDRPLLPKNDCLPIKDGNPVMPMFSRERIANPTEDEAKPASAKYLYRLIPLLVATVIVFRVVLRDHTLRTIGERRFGFNMFLWLSLCIAIILADTVQMWNTWRNLRRLLVYLDRLPLRRTLASLPGLSWKSVWTVSGNTLEQRYHLISKQLESLIHLRNLLKDRSKENSTIENKVLEELKQCEEIEVASLVAWYVKPEEGGTWHWRRKPNNFDCLKPLQDFQEALAATAGSVMTNVLRSAWQKERGSLILETTQADSKSNGRKGEAEETPLPAAPSNVLPHVRAAEEFFVLPYLGFIQNILGRMRTIILGCLCLFVATTFAVSSYPFDPLPVLGGIFLAVFVIAGCTLTIVFVQMHRDPTLSHITNTSPGELGSQFWMHIITFGIGPLLGLLTTLFPSITDFITSWLQPGTQALQ